MRDSRVLGGGAYLCAVAGGVDDGVLLVAVPVDVDLPEVDRRSHLRLPSVLVQNRWGLNRSRSHKNLLSITDRAR